MPPTPETLDFIRRHRSDDVRTLALQAARYPGVDVPWALTQIAGWQAARTKVPSWAACEGIVYPAHLPMEQCSSEVTARYKAALVAGLGGPHGTLADLTGGFGIDCAFLSEGFAHAAYVERQEALCQAARHNFALLCLTHIDVHCADSVEYLRQMPPVDWLFLDPARSDGHGGKTVAIADCEPDVSALEPLLLEKASCVLVKLSPMLDLSQALHTLHSVGEAHIVSVAGECKELLLWLSRQASLHPDDVPIRCVNLPADAAPFTFTRRQEQSLPCPLAEAPHAYLYEPNASLLKAGAFRSVACIYKVEKLHPNSHLYTSDEALPCFPGRMFCVDGWCGFGKKEVKALLDGVPRANLTVRNFPATVAELRRRLRLAEGGDVYVFATTLADGRKALIRCSKP